MIALVAKIPIKEGKVDEAIEAFYNRLEKITLVDLSIGTTQKLWKNSDLLIFT